MPAICLNNLGERVFSFDYSYDDWKTLKENYAELGLHMKCCGAPAIPKTSKLGTQYFAHKSDACGEGGESIEHLRCKELVVYGARKAGWLAYPEESGIDSEGNPWVADVLCSRGKIKVAFEIQLANQTFEEYKRRTNSYNNSNIRCMWLIRRKQKHPIAEQMILDRLGTNNRKNIFGQHPDRKDLPVFMVDVSDLTNIFVFFPWHHGNGPFQIPLDEFAFGALNKKMIFRDNCWCWNVA